MKNILTRQAILLGIMILLFTGCQQKFSQTNLLDATPGFFERPDLFAVHEDKPNANRQETTKFFASKKIPAETEITGAILDIDPVKQEDYLKGFPRTENIETVFILASTKHKTPEKNLFTYSLPGVLGLPINQEIVNTLSNSNLVQDLGEVTENSFWKKDIIQNISANFPNAKFVLLSLNENINGNEQELATHILRQTLKGNVAVIALSSGAKAPNLGLAEFQNHFATDVITHFDADKFDELPVESPVPVKILALLLKRSGVQRAQNLSLTEGSLQVFFLPGPPANIEQRPIYLVGFGDIMLGRYVRELMEVNTLEYPFEKMDANYLRVNDILLANLEGPVTKKAVRNPGGMSFGFFIDVPPLLNKHYFDALSQANNHTMDKGAEAYAQSMSSLRNEGLTAFGNPKEINDDTVARFSIQGQKIAFIGLEEVLSKIDDDKTIQLVKDLTAEGYKPVFFPHWGTEYRNEPNNRQKELAHKLIDAGVFAVIGAHPHVPQSYENYNNHPVFYSLGNAIFDQYWSKGTQEGLSIAMEISDKTITIYLLPIKLERSQFRLMNDEESKIFLEKFAGFGEHSEEEKQAIMKGKLTLMLK